MACRVPPHMAWRAVQVAQAPVQGHEVLCMLKKKGRESAWMPTGGKTLRARHARPTERGETVPRAPIVPAL
jgi:hypothetical protein